MMNERSLFVIHIIFDAGKMFIEKKGKRIEKNEMSEVIQETFGHRSDYESQHLVSELTKRAEQKGY